MRKSSTRLSALNRAPASGAGSSTMKRVAITNRPPFSCYSCREPLLGRGGCFLTVPGRRRCSGLRLHRVFVDRSGAGYVAIEGRAGRYKVVLHFLVALGSGAYRDPGRINALLLNQVVLRVDGTLCSQRVGLLLVGSRLANHHNGGIGLLLQVQSDIIQASLRLVVDPSRALLIPIEADRAKRLRLGSGRWRRCFHIDRGGRSRRLTLVVLHAASNGDGAGGRAGCAQRSAVAAAADLTGRRAVGISQRPVLRAYTLGGDGCRTTRLNSGRIGRATDGRRIVLLDGEVGCAIRELANLLPFGNVTSNGVVTG